MKDIKENDNEEAHDNDHCVQKCHLRATSYYYCDRHRENEDQESMIVMPSCCNQATQRMSNARILFSQ